MQKKIKIPQGLRLAILVIALLPLLYVFGKSMYNSRKALDMSPPEPSKTYFEVFLPNKNEIIEPYLTYPSDINKPIASYKIKNSTYRIMILEVVLSSDSFDPSMFYIHQDKKKLSKEGSFKFVKLDNSTQAFFRLDPFPAINSIQAYLNPKYPIQKLIKAKDYFYGKLSGDILFSFNSEDKRFIGVESENINVQPAPLEFLYFSKNEKHYIAVGVGTAPEGTDENYLKSLIVEE